MKKVLLSVSLALGLSSFAQLAVDTSGIQSWNLNHNSWTTWDVGAFNDNTNGSQFDLGWGIYNVNTHYIKGDSLHIIQLLDGSYKQLFMEELANGSYNFHYADLDGSNDQTALMAKQDFATKNFGYYSIENGQADNTLEPATADWDFVFTKYNRLSDGYPVTGVLTNKHIKVAEAWDTDTMDVDPSTLTYSEEINAIGYDWKALSGWSFELVDSLSYYLIEDMDTSVLVFHEFSGSAGGGIIKFTINGEMKEAVMGAGYPNRVFFDLQNDEVHSSARNAWDLAFDGSQFGAVIRTNEASGVKLWVYPNGDNTAWLSIDDANSVISAFRVYPNPATDVCNINIGGNAVGTVTLKVVDMSGRMIHSDVLSVYSGMANHTFNISEYNSGMYNVILQDENGNSWNQRLIKK